MEPVIVFVLYSIFYLLPAINAKSRKHHQTAAIFLTNLFFGWTVIGWIVCLIWSASYVRKETELT